MASPGELAKRMADLAHLIRDLILRSFEGETTAGKLHKEFEAFRQTLIPDLKSDEFADMYAQTIAYGLFAARCQPVTTGERFSRERAAHLIPKTNPFLRRLFNEIAGPELDEKITPFVDDLVALLRDSDMHSILSDFGKRSGKEDPVVHFYEDFLQEYDPKMRELRGVYYTPEQVVSYIVRSVDHLLKTKFNKPLGLADKDVLILDPACGTGTFLYFVIRHIYQTLIEQGQRGKWNSYVSDNLLKRIFGFELLMAPYAMAHLKLGLLLQELGYKFDSDERLGIYLTNTLEEAIQRSELIFAQYIADEANAASEIKREKKIMVVIGNPPYSGHSANRSFIERAVKPGETYTVITGGPRREQMVKKQKTAKQPMIVREKTFIGSLVDDYYYLDGNPLGERNPKWLQDDYVKFIRFGQWRIQETGYGILAFITNNGYLDNPTFRGMRQQLMRTFTEIKVLDLHGSAKKQEQALDGSKDENVFDIQQGVTIALFQKDQGPSNSATIGRFDLWGTRAAKYKNLLELDSEHTPWDSLVPEAPFYEFAHREADLSAEYRIFWQVTDIFPVNVLGFQTHRDHFAIDFEEELLLERIKEMRDPDLTDGDLEKQYNLPNSQEWSLSDARKQIASDQKWRRSLIKCSYRPFDLRWCYFSTAIMDRPRRELIDHVANKQNFCLGIGRQGTAVNDPQWSLLSVSRVPIDANIFRRGGINVFPLYLYAETSAGPLFEGEASKDTSAKRKANLNQAFVERLSRTLKFQFLSEGTGDTQKTCGPEDVVHYIYALLSSPAYRARYADFLKLDFPRIPLTKDKRLFARLASKGAELLTLHLMESPALQRFITRYEQPGAHLVEKVRYADPNPAAKIKSGRVYINNKQYFEGVPRNVWEFRIGGFQVCDKWLKDRKGRNLSADDIDHYQKIIVALKETIRLMAEIDALIPSWPLP